jgi:PAS domain-containing protein
MMLTGVECGPIHADLLTFECPKCNHVNKLPVDDPMRAADGLAGDWGFGRLPSPLRGSTIFRTQFPEVQDAWILAHAIVDTVREPLIVLDQDLRVVAASRSFYLTFKVDADDTQGKFLYDLGDGQWDIPKLRLLLGKIVPEHGATENYEVEHDFPSIGRRTMLLNVRKVLYEKGAHSTFLLGIEDITEKRTFSATTSETRSPAP